MNPVCLQFSGITLHWYGVLMATGMLAGLFSWQWVARHRPWPPAFYSDLLFWIVLSGIAGARIAYIASHWDEFADRPFDMLRVHQGGLVFYGGFLAAALAVWLFSRFHREPFTPIVDLVATSVPLGHAFGRVGCLMHGCCHGSLTQSPLGISYPPNSMAWVGQVDAGRITEQTLHSAPVHPVQLYEAALNLGIYALLVVAYRRPHRDGRITALYLLTYPVVRFTLEFLRGDARLRPLEPNAIPLLSAFSMAQWTSIALFAIGCFLWKRTAGKPAPATATPA
jgi:phosphatidylglycerol:prolipoprotein diacylglycerol transferase